jgi:hypothetical protein
MAKMTQMTVAMQEALASKLDMRLHEINGELHEEKATVKQSHDVTGLQAILEGRYGSNVKGRLAYNLNMIAQRLLRDAIKAAMKPLGDSSDGLLTDEELAEMFGMEIRPLYTVNQCSNWVMLTYVVAHDVAKQTEANEQGIKSTPFAWMQELIKTPVTMVIKDREYGVNSSLAKQAANMAKLGIVSPDGLKKFEAIQRESSLEATRAKLDIVRGSYNPELYTSNGLGGHALGTDEINDGIAEFVAETGLNIPALMQEIAIKSYEKSVSNAEAGKFLGDIDEQLLEFLPKHYKEDIAKKQARLEAAH